jgi:hypothetical protein
MVARKPHTDFIEAESCTLNVISDQHFRELVTALLDDPSTHFDLALRNNHFLKHFLFPL